MADQDSSLKGKYVLVLEDDKFLSSLISDKLTILRDAGTDVIFAFDAEEARGTLEKRTPDLLLLDIVLPGLNGLDFLEHIRRDERFKDLPVFVLSNLDQTDRRERAKDLGVIAYYVKANSTLEDIAQQVKTQLKRA